MKAWAAFALLLAAATDAQKSPGGEGPAQHQYDEKALADVVAGKLTMRAAAFRTHDVRRALPGAERHPDSDPHLRNDFDIIQPMPQ